MTWYQLVYLTCDHNDCDHSYLSRVHGEGMRATRTRASEIGWKVHESHDYCPDHADVGVPRIRLARLPAEKPEIGHTPRKRRAPANTGAGDG